ncbi:hypothetical protein ACB092_10G053100 [Castanea dentata]
MGLDPSVFHWPEGKSFKAGDVLIFNYSNPLFKVEQVTKTQFDNCYSDYNPIKTYDSGHDKVKVEKGTTYFICAVPDYCGYGMRIVINAQGAEYVVGGKIGWDLDPSVFHWPEGKSFKAGDVLIFNYSNPLFKVEQVNKTQFDNCYSDYNPIKTYDSGHDKVKVEKGTTYFICAVPDYCGYGMRIVINAT